MIKIVYRPEYDEKIFLGDRPRVMGTEYLGTKGLLQELGLRLSIPTNAKTDVEREADYHNAMQKHLSDTPFEKAARIDPFGVASKLLHWRDDLLMAGWDGKATGAKLTKLSVLAEIETDFHSKGAPDYWREVYQQSNAKGMTTLNLEGLNNGMYFATVKSEKAVSTLKFVKE